MTIKGERPLTFTGSAWVFGDEVNTDDMYPGFAMKLPRAEAAQHMFDASRPDWPTLVQPGDIVVAGRNFGLGSSRPVAELFVELGVACLIAEQYNSLFLRNCLNYGLPAITVPDATSIVTEGDRLEVDVTEGLLLNHSQGSKRYFSGFSDFLADMLRSGGLIKQLEAGGYLRSLSGRKE
ncbi:3-isopropylmalate dehydratase small subunit [Nocardioidaceae bacterium Broad-1]|nr:3-isopropylmalate dehydratase small subunit [Nocardioidaceae bacterium Broad-1]